MKRITPLALSVALLAAAVTPQTARADRYPTISSDGLFFGARLDPGAALSLAYDLDIYLTGDRFLSVGPAVTFSFLGEDGSGDGQRQDWLLAIDFLRFKVAVTGPDGPFRVYVLIGGGMYLANLPEQESEELDVVLVPDGTPARAVIRYGALEGFGGLLTIGAGADWYLVDNFAIALQLVVSVRASEESRVPDYWGQALLGIRFGL